MDYWTYLNDDKKKRQVKASLTWLSSLPSAPQRSKESENGAKPIWKWVHNEKICSPKNSHILLLNMLNEPAIKIRALFLAWKESKGKHGQFFSLRCYMQHTESFYSLSLHTNLAFSLLLCCIRKFSCILP